MIKLFTLFQCFPLDCETDIRDAKTVDRKSDLDFGHLGIFNKSTNLMCTCD